MATIAFGGEGIPGLLRRRLTNAPCPAEQKALIGKGETFSEREDERLDRLFEKMAFLKDKGGTLSREDRRDQAEGAAMELARMIGGDVDEEDDDSSGEEV